MNHIYLVEKRIVVPQIVSRFRTSLNHGSEKMDKNPGSKVLRALLAVAVLFAVGIAGAQFKDKLFQTDSAPDEVYSWTAPTDGGSVHHYVAEVYVNRSKTLVFDNLTTTTLQFPAEYGDDYMVRVAAVNAENRQGPWSNWSEPYMVEVDSPGF
jgi:hypothetical protein